MTGGGIVITCRLFEEDMYLVRSWFNDATCEEKMAPLPRGSKKLFLRKIAVSEPMQS